MLLIITLAPMAGGLTLEESYNIIFNKRKQNELLD